MYLSNGITDLEFVIRDKEEKIITTQKQKKSSTAVGKEVTG